MPFPLPLNPEFRKEIIRFWIDDVQDRLDLRDVESATVSWKIANELYLSLPPGCGDSEIEESLVKSRVKLTQTHSETK